VAAISLSIVLQVSNIIDKAFYRFLTHPAEIASDKPIPIPDTRRNEFDFQYFILQIS
jgi:hypothetical protein